VVRALDEVEKLPGFDPNHVEWDYFLFHGMGLRNPMREASPERTRGIRHRRSRGRRTPLSLSVLRSRPVEHEGQSPCINHIRDIIIVYVNTTAPLLAPLFRSDTQAEILARLMLNPDRSYTTADLARVGHAPYATAHREVQRLLAAGILTEERVGRAIRVTANTAAAFYPPLAELLRLSYGPATVVPRSLSQVGGIDEAYIYGSWAARRSGEKGDAPGDIDVVVVGTPSRSAIAGAAGDAERALGREVNIRIVSPDTWKTAEDLFVKTVQQRPLIRLYLERSPR
jgi:predicted nucleotidyltransferase